MHPVHCQTSEKLGSVFGIKFWTPPDNCAAVLTIYVPDQFLTPLLLADQLDSCCIFYTKGTVFEALPFLSTKKVSSVKLLIVG